MSISNFEIKWIKFTKSLRIVGVLLIFLVIPYLALAIIPIHFIFAMVSLRDLKNINRELNDGYLKSFRSKYLAASILKLFGSILVHIGAAMIAIFNSLSLPYYYSIFGIVFPPMIVFAIGFVFMIVGSGVEIGAWNNLNLFIHHNDALFQTRISSDTSTKVDALRSGALLWTIGFFIIGWIIQIIGYFGLKSAAEGVLKHEVMAPATQYHQPNSPPAQELQPVSKIEFCAMCGAKLEGGASYCSNCGVKMIN